MPHLLGQGASGSPPGAASLHPTLLCTLLYSVPYPVRVHLYLPRPTRGCRRGSLRPQISSWSTVSASCRRGLHPLRPACPARAHVRWCAAWAISYVQHVCNACNVRNARNVHSDCDVSLCQHMCLHAPRISVQHSHSESDAHTAYMFNMLKSASTRCVCSPACHAHQPLLHVSRAPPCPLAEPPRQSIGKEGKLE